MASRRFILGTKLTTKVVSRVAAATSITLQRFGMAPGSNRTIPVRQRSAGYDIFNDARTVGQLRAPGAQSGAARRQVVGRVDYTIPRMAEHLPLLYEEMHNQRELGGADNDIDEMGRTYIERQRRFMGQRAANFRLLALGGMMRGNLYAHESSSGDEMYLDYTSTDAVFDINFRIPSGNLSQLDMLGAGSIIDAGWQNPTANIPDHLMQINAAFQQLTSSRLEVAVCNSTMWTNLVNNDYVVSMAGVANRPFELLTRSNENASNGLPNTTFEARLAAVPWLTWLITDEGLDIGAQSSTTYTKFIPDNYVWFGPDPQLGVGRDLMEMMEGPEPIRERAGAAPTVRNGLHAWVNDDEYDPPVAKLHTIDNALPALYVPAATAYGQVANF